MMYSPGGSLYYGRANSDVMGCRRPTDGVFTYVSSDTSHAEGVPVATPRGRSSKFPWRELESSPQWSLVLFVFQQYFVTKKTEVL